MPIRKLLLPLTGTAAGEAALTTALTVARMWDAHLTALHVRVDSRDVAPLAGEGLSGAMIEEMMSATEKESTDRSNAVRAMFDRFRQALPRPLGSEARFERTGNRFRLAIPLPAGVALDAFAARRGESVTVGDLTFSVMLTRGGAVRWFKVTRERAEPLGPDGI